MAAKAKRLAKDAGETFISAMGKLKAERVSTRELGERACYNKMAAEIDQNNERQNLSLLCVVREERAKRQTTHLAACVLLQRMKSNKQSSSPEN